MTKLSKTAKTIGAAFAVAVTGAAALSACTPADVASSNLSRAADNFQIYRQINFINTITNQNIVTIRGLCSLGNNDKAGQRTVTCKVGTDEKGEGVFVKNFFGLSSTVAYSSVQIGAAGVSAANYDITWNPGVAVPHFKGPGGEPLNASIEFKTTAPGTGTSATTPSTDTKSSTDAPAAKKAPVGAIIGAIAPK